VHGRGTQWDQSLTSQPLAHRAWKILSTHTTLPARTPLDSDRAEASFLASVLDGRIKSKPEHLKGNNLQHLAAVMMFIEGREGGVVAVDRHVSGSDGAGHAVVDIVLRGRPFLPGAVDESITAIGVTWVKLTARHRNAMRRVAQGDCGFGQRSIIDAMGGIVDVGRDHTVDFSPPHVLVVCAGGVYSCVAAAIRQIGATVLGDIHECEDPGCCLHEEDSDEDHDAVTLVEGDRDRASGGTGGDACARIAPVDKGAATDAHDSSRVNLDVSTMICLVSDLTNTLPDPSQRYVDKSIETMAVAERARPLLPLLIPQLAGKQYVACAMAVKTFRGIVDTIGGLGERARATALLATVTVLDGVVSDRCGSLRPSARIKPTPREVFGIADRHRITTVSANAGFVRAAKSQGIILATLQHESRALAEMSPRVPIVVAPAAGGVAPGANLG
jgi:hypothetical protein